MRRDGGRLQVLRECGHYFGRHRTCPSDTQETILVWARSISTLRVTKANVGSSTRISTSPARNPECAGRIGFSARNPKFDAFNAPVPPHDRGGMCAPDVASTEKENRRKGVDLPFSPSTHLISLLPIFFLTSFPDTRIETIRWVEAPHLRFVVLRRVV
jgi:hypothetical protein